MSRLSFIPLIFIAFGALLLLHGGEAVSDVEREPDDTSDHSPDPLLDSAVEEAVGVETVYLIEMKGPISSPLVFIARRATKEAIENGVTTLVFEMDTPGGSGAAMFEIMQILSQFPGRVITYVNDEAISAGALIAFASHEIYFAPTAVIGAAAPVVGSGADIPETMNEKLLSYIRARIRTMSDDPRAAKVLEAMVDRDIELEIDGKVISEKGRLLTLTAREASELYGDPPQPLLGNGIVENLDDLLRKSFGDDAVFEVVTFETTWSENLARFTNAIAPVLIGIGFVLLLLEIKTPGFGLPGVVGVALVVITLIGQNAAGLAGNEVYLIIGLGLLLIAIEIFIMPGSVIFGLLGVLIVVGGLIYTFADIWPEGAIDDTITIEQFVWPATQVMISAVITTILAYFIIRYVPNTRMGRHLMLATSVGGGVAARELEAANQPSLLGAEGKAITPLRPSGEVEIGGRRYQAHAFAPLEKGARIRVAKVTSFSLEVEAR